VATGKRAVLVGPLSATGSSLAFPPHQLEPAQLIMVSAVFLTDATVGSRNLVAEVLDPVGQRIAMMPIGSIPASTEVMVCLSSSWGSAAGTPVYIGGSYLYNGPVPVCGLWAGCSIRLRDLASVSAGDAWSNSVLATCLG